MRVVDLPAAPFSGNVAELSYNCCTWMPLPVLWRPAAPLPTLLFVRMPVVAMVAFRFELLLVAFAMLLMLPAVLPAAPPVAYNLLLRGFSGGKVVEFMSAKNSEGSPLP